MSARLVTEALLGEPSEYYHPLAVDLWRKSKPKSDFLPRLSGLLTDAQVKSSRRQPALRSWARLMARAHTAFNNADTRRISDSIELGFCPGFGNCGHLWKTSATGKNSSIAESKAYGPTTSQFLSGNPGPQRFPGQLLIMLYDGLIQNRPERAETEISTPENPNDLSQASNAVSRCIKHHDRTQHQSSI